jgi:hypothetical protein
VSPADRNLKAQLGARVPSEIVALAEAARVKAGISRNEWVERAIVEQARREGVEALPLLVPGQIPLIADESMPPDRVEFRNDGETMAVITGTTKHFDPSCIGKTYHWKHGPGRPCRSCGGEIE